MWIMTNFWMNSLISLKVKDWQDRRKIAPVFLATIGKQDWFTFFREPITLVLLNIFEQKSFFDFSDKVIA
jgi:hypothetical protein